MRFVLVGTCALAVLCCAAVERHSAVSQETVSTPVTVDKSSPQPIGITAALLMNARFADTRNSRATMANADDLPVPQNGSGPLVVVGDAHDAQKTGARYFVPPQTMLRTTPLTFAAPALEISPRELWRKQGRFQIIDVREDAEFRASHIPGSERRSMFAELGPKARPVALFCLTGHRSAALVEQLRARGVRNVYSVRGGWLDWQHQRLPLVTQLKPSTRHL